MKRHFLGALLVAATIMAWETQAMAEDWQKEADRRIEKLRKGDFTITLVDQDGHALGRVKADLNQTRSKFLFGTCVTGNPESESPTEKKYFDFIRKHFNSLVSENDMKWYSTEKKRDEMTFARADRLIRWAKKHNLALRGHCLFWSKKKFVQDWVQELSDKELRAEIDEYLGKVVPHFSGDVICWDVNNEMLDGSYYKDRLGEDIRTHIFKKAHELDPNVPLFVNEYGVLDNDAKMKRYIDLVKKLRKAGAPIHGIGIQEHASERFADNAEEAEEEKDRPERKGRGPLIPRDVWKRLDMIGELGLPIHLTEISSRTASDERRADTLEALFRVGYAHPKVEAILLWGFWERRHWLGRDAGLVESDFSLNEAGRRISDLLLKEWRTRTTETAGEDGRVEFRGFEGEYCVTVETADGKLSGTVKLDKQRGEAKVMLRPEK